MKGRFAWIGVIESKTPRRTAFVTGATGFVGSFLIDRLLADGCNVIALARGREAGSRVATALGHVNGSHRQALPGDGRLQVMAGDVRDPQLGLDGETARKLALEIDDIWHCAANFGTGAAGETPLAVNVEGTRHLLDFASRCQHARPVSFHYVSTAFAADAPDGLACELAPGLDGSSRNDYEDSKRKAERLVLGWPRSAGTSVAILRPSIILGHSQTGRASGFAAYYDFLRSLCLHARAQRTRLRRFGGAAPSLRVRTRPDLLVNLVTIDFVIDAMCALTRSPRGPCGIYHLVHEKPVTMGDIIGGMCRSIGLNRLELCSAAEFAERPMTPAERRFHGMISFERPYLEQEVRFDNRQFRALVPSGILPAPEITADLLERINRGYLDHCERQAQEARAWKQAQARAPHVTLNATLG